MENSIKTSVKNPIENEEWYKHLQMARSSLINAGLALTEIPYPFNDFGKILFYTSAIGKISNDVNEILYSFNPECPVNKSMKNILVDDVAKINELSKTNLN